MAWVCFAPPDIFVPFFMEYVLRDNILGYKTNWNQFKRINTERVLKLYGLQLEISNRKVTGKAPNIWEPDRF